MLRISGSLKSGKSGLVLPDLTVPINTQLFNINVSSEHFPQWSHSDVTMKM